MRRLWTEPALAFDTPLHRIDRAGILPRPARSIPLWFGGTSEVAFRRAGRVGDGITAAGGGPRRIEQAGRRPDVLADAGQDPGTFPIEFTTMYGIGEARWLQVCEVRE